MPDDYGISDAALEQRIAELSDDEFDQLAARCRPPKLTAAQRAAEAIRQYRGYPA